MPRLSMVGGNIPAVDAPPLPARMMPSGRAVLGQAQLGTACIAQAFLLTPTGDRLQGAIG